MKGFIMFGIAMILLSALILAGCGSPTTSPTSTQTPVSGQASVNMSGLVFIPETLRVTVGTTVTWTNNDSTPHTVSSNSAVFESGNMDGGATFSHTFNQAGTFEYHCQIHPSMNGRIIVE